MFGFYRFARLVEQSSWARERSGYRKSAIAISLGIAGFSFDYVLYHSAGVYLTAPTLLIVILTALFTGFIRSLVVAVLLSIANDYYFIPPIGGIFENAASFEHFFILVFISVFTSYLVASLRLAFLTVFKAQQEAERAKHEAERANEAERARQEAERVSDLMEHVLAYVSHDFLTPLTSIKMAVELILKTPKQFEKHQRLLAKILVNIDRAESMIHSLLDVSKIRSGKVLQLDFQYCELTTQVKEMVEETALLHMDRLTFTSTESLWGDWGLSGIRRVLENLVNNAIKYGAPNGLIEVKLERKGGLAILSVHNEGPEIPSHDQSRLFESFHRTVVAKTKTVKGWGLGLALVKGIAEAHGGTVGVQSSQEYGTTFNVTLPIRTAGEQKDTLVSGRKAS